MTESQRKSEVLWDEGWYGFARRLASPNFGPRPASADISLLVLHSISLPPGEFGGGFVQALFTNNLDWNAHPHFQSITGTQVSSHFFIARDGALWQFVSCDDRAWHAGVSSYLGQDNCNDYSIGIELEGLEGETFEPRQYETLAALVPALLQRYAVSDIAGHEHIAPGRKADPGAGMDWALLQKTLGLTNQCFPEAVRIESLNSP
jgi:AmpD protein